MCVCDREQQLEQQFNNKEKREGAEEMSRELHVDKQGERVREQTQQSHKNTKTIVESTLDQHTIRN